MGLKHIGFGTMHGMESSCIVSSLPMATRTIHVQHRTYSPTHERYLISEEYLRIAFPDMIFITSFGKGCGKLYLRDLFNFGTTEKIRSPSQCSLFVPYLFPNTNSLGQVCLGAIPSIGFETREQVAEFAVQEYLTSKFTNNNPRWKGKYINSNYDESLSIDFFVDDYVGREKDQPDVAVPALH